MIKFDINHLFPCFLLNDHDGYAMAKAIEKGLLIFCDTVQKGLDTVFNAEKMPEWRLDEMAWEMGCLYDYEADIESKRKWVQEAIPIFASFGTADALYKVLEGYFDQVEVEENWMYSGLPYHFRVTVSGQWTDDNEQWARNAIDATKNVRSVLDDLAIGGAARVKIVGESAFWRFPYGMTDADRMTGTHPIESMIGRSADIRVMAASEAKGQKYPYAPAGTFPQENIVMGMGESGTLLAGEGSGFLYGYPHTSEEQKAGTTPQPNTLAGETDADVTLGKEGKAYLYSYPQTGEDLKAGTTPQENTVGAADNPSLGMKSDAVSAVFSYRTASGNTPCGSDEIF